MLRTPLLAATGALLVASLFGPATALVRAQACAPNCSPARAVPIDRWDGIEPSNVLGDTTDFLFNGSSEPGCNDPFWFQLDIEAGLLFAATGSALEIRDTRSNPAAPPRIANLCKPVVKSWNESDKDFYLTSVAAPPRAPDGTPPPVVAVGIEAGMGLVIVDVSTPSSPRPIYQNDGATNSPHSIKALHATRTGGRDYAVAVNDSREMLLYDLTNAAALTNTCAEKVDAPRCNNVFLRKLSYQSSPLLSFFKVAGVDRFIVVRWSAKTQVYDLAPALEGGDVRFVTEIGPNPLDFDAWIHNDLLFFATTDGEKLRIYRVDCAYGSGSCAPTLRSTTAIPGGPHPNGAILSTDKLTFSRDAEQEYLFAGTTQISAGGPQREYVLDISKPGEPTDLTPQVHPDGYWGWYYEENTTGFRNVAPRTAVVQDAYLYRSAWSLLDVHELVGLSPPVARFDLPEDTVVGGETIDLVDRSARGPLEWEWKFFDGAQLLDTLTDRNPSWTVPTSASYPHDYRIRLTVTNDLGSDSIEKTLTVYDPTAPPLAVTKFKAGLVCYTGLDLCEASVAVPVSFAHTIEGTPESYDYDWNGDGIFEDTGNALQIDSHTYSQAGDYRPSLRISAASTTVTYEHQETIRVAADPALMVFSANFETGTFAGWSSVH